MSLLNRFWPYSDSWHVAINSNVKHTMQGMGMHEVAVHDMAVHDAVVHGMDVPGKDVPKRKIFWQ